MQYFEFLFKLRGTLTQNTSVVYVTINVDVLVVCSRLFIVTQI